MKQKTIIRRGGKAKDIFCEHLLAWARSRDGLLTFVVHQISTAIRLRDHRISEQIAIVRREHCSCKLEAEIIADNYAINDYCSICCLRHWEIDPGTRSV
jgi:hypothetical protein